MPGTWQSPGSAGRSKGAGGWLPKAWGCGRGWTTLGVICGKVLVKTEGPVLGHTGWLHSGRGRGTCTAGKPPGVRAGPPPAPDLWGACTSPHHPYHALPPGFSGFLPDFPFLIATAEREPGWWVSTVPSLQAARLTVSGCLPSSHRGGPGHTQLPVRWTPPSPLTHPTPTSPLGSCLLLSTTQNEDLYLLPCGSTHTWGGHAVTGTSGPRGQGRHSVVLGSLG